jgi:hypothetical protein
MFRYALLAAAGLIFVPLEDANAIPVTLRIDSRVTLGCGLCTGFKEDTGLSTPAPDGWDVFALLSFDTSVNPQTADDFARFYLLDQPGAKLSIFVGSWSRHHSAIGLRLSEDFGVGGACDLLTVYSYPGPSERGSVFNTSNCRHPETKLPDYSLDTFVESLSGFFGTPFDTIINPDRASGSSWWLQGHVRSVTRVPEPATLWLLSVGLLGLAISRRRS